MLANLVGLAVFVHHDMHFWAPRGQEELPGGPGDAFLWFDPAGWVLLIFLCFDLLWAGLLVFCRRLPARWWQLLVWAVVVACWVAYIGYARTRHFQG